MSYNTEASLSELISEYFFFLGGCPIGWYRKLEFPNDSDGYCEAVLDWKSETLLSLIRIKLLKWFTAGFVLQEKHTFKM